MSPDRKHRCQGRSDDLHGNAPDESRVVPLLIDVINDLSFPDSNDLVRRSVALAESIAKLKKRCKKAGIPAIYVNDNRGDGVLISPPCCVIAYARNRLVAK